MANPSESLKSVYMPNKDYDSLETVAHWINESEYALSLIREHVGAMYPDNARFVSQFDYEDAANAFEYAQKELLKAIDALIP